MRRAATTPLLLVLALGSTGVAAQSPADNAATPTPYVDRVIDNLPPEPQGEGAALAYDTSGWPRFLRLETRLGTEAFDDANRTRAGFAVYGLLVSVLEARWFVFRHKSIG